MYKITIKLMSLITGALLLWACDDDGTLTSLKPVQFGGTPSASVNSIVLNADNMEALVVSLSWQKATYPVSAPVTYTIQFATPADTIGATAWTNASEREIGEDVLSGSFTGKEINDIAGELGLEPGQEGTLVARVRAYLDRPAYSKAVAIAVTPYTVFTDYPALYIAGDFQGWNIGEPTKIVSVNDDGIYEGYVYLPEGGTYEFKLYAQPAWEPISYGDGGEGELIVANYAGSNFSAGSAGYYLFSVNLNDMTYLLIKTEWGMIGAATPGGWDADTKLNYDPLAQAWTVTASMKADGSFKFRANNAWQLDFGKNEEGELAYANHPWKMYVDQPHFTVPSDGNYTITLDLHEPGNYKYNIRKN